MSSSSLVGAARRAISPATRRVRFASGAAREAYRRSRTRAARWWNRRGTQHACYLCQKKFGWFLPLFSDDSASQLFALFDVAGSDLRNFYCPHCFCFDRERHLIMYFDRLNLWNAFRGAVLHFAPEKRLRARIAALPPREYVAADLYPQSGDIRRMSATDIEFPDASFDAVLCNHVLEHIPHDTQAMREIFRVLKPGGIAVVQTPYARLLARSIEDPNIVTEHLRARIYGQRDHVRLYGLDLFERLQSVGFAIESKSHAEVLPDMDGAYYGVNPNEELILVRRP